ncbi:Hypothetical protein HVR_LOCUS67 [uncultured virus]|nr:Hypothetical protein HVR_LOCUS67 [uncultured virus]
MPIESFTEEELSIIKEHKLESIMQPGDLKLVMHEASIDRKQAFLSLIGNGGDIVNAILELTM